MEMIKTENVSYSYDVWIKDVKHKREALHGINLDIHKGEFVAILGANGSGKSTLAKHFNVLLQPDEGRVLVNGRSTEDKDAVWEIRSTVGMVFQNPDNQIIGSSVEEDVAFGLENRKVPSCEIRSKVADSLKAVGLFTNRKFSPSKLSGGQKQRVAIAGIIALDSNCIVLDEPTSMLDPLSRKELMDVLVKLHRQGRTIVLITHHTDEAALAERIVIMNNGNVTAEGTPEEIFNKPSVLYDNGLDIPQITELGRALSKRGILRGKCYLKSDELVADVLGSTKDRRFNIMGEAGCNAEDTECDAEDDRDSLLELRKVSFTYGKRTINEKKVLEDIEVKLYPGEFTGLIGSSGAGKTTLIKLMNGLLKPDSGKLLLHNEVLENKKHRLSLLRSKVGLVFQYPEHQLFCKTVLEDVVFGPKHIGMTSEDAEESARKCLQLVGIDEKYFDISPFDLSGGQMRRVAIAGVLAMKPELLILDEPAAGLDPKSKDQMFSLLESLRKENGVSILLVSHDMEDIAKYTDRVLVLHDKKLVADDTPEKVFKHVEMLHTFGLDVPVVTNVLSKLQEGGFPVKRMITVDAAADEVYQVFQERS